MAVKQTTTYDCEPVKSSNTGLSENAGQYVPDNATDTMNGKYL
jgi:hypothetical protein